MLACYHNGCLTTIKRNDIKRKDIKRQGHQETRTESKDGCFANVIRTELCASENLGCAFTLRRDAHA